MRLDDYVVQQGQGLPLVFIHGSFASDATWKKIIAEQATKHHCIAIKLPGHGGAPEPNDMQAPTLATELDLVVDLIEQTTNQAVHLIGHSFGGVVALAVALSGRVKIRQLTLFEPVAAWVLAGAQDHQHYQQVQDCFALYQQDLAHPNVDACQRVIDFWGQAGDFKALPESIQEQMRGLTAHNFRHWQLSKNISTTAQDLQRCTIPTHVIYGTCSSPVTRAVCEHLATLMPYCQVFTIQGASHFLVTTHPSQCLAMINRPWSVNNTF